MVNLQENKNRLKSILDGVVCVTAVGAGKPARGALLGVVGDGGAEAANDGRFRGFLVSRLRFAARRALSNWFWDKTRAKTRILFVVFCEISGELFNVWEPDNPCSQAVFGFLGRFG